MNTPVQHSTPTTASFDPGQPLFASIEGRAGRLGPDEVVFFDPEHKQSHVMTLQVLQAMDLCREFQPMDLHARRVAEQLPGLKGKEAAVRRVLEGLASRGLLVSDDAWLRRFEERPALEPAPLAGLFIRACDRPAQLHDLLHSLIEHDRRYGLPADVIVVDDSTDPDCAAAHRQKLADFGEQVSVSARYVGRPEWDRVIRDLDTRVGPAAGALLRRSEGHGGRRGGGIGKNLISLLAAGRRYMLLDDDFLFPLRRHAEHVPGSVCSPLGWAVRTFATVEAALASGSDPDGDLLQEHLSLCGQSLGTLLRRHPGMRLERQALVGMAPSRLPWLDPSKRVVSTVNGHRGQSGASGIGWVFLLDQQARSALCQSDDSWRALRGDPPLWWGCSRYQISDGGAFTPFAIDNSRMLPPTSPFGRGEDALFSALCAVAHGDGVQVDTPFTVGHRQEGARDRSELLGKPETPDLNHCLGELARHLQADLYGAGPVERLGVFTAKLQDIAGSSDEGILSYLGEYLAYRRSLLIENMQTVATSDKTLPPAWRSDMASLVEANAKALVERGTPVLAGWASGSGRDACVAAFRKEAAVLCDGLRSWPAAWELALGESARWMGQDA